MLCQGIAYATFNMGLASAEGQTLEGDVRNKIQDHFEQRGVGSQLWTDM